MKTMRTLALFPIGLVSGVLVSGMLALAQDSADMVDKAPPPVEAALRARIDQYYHAFMAGKYKEAYLLVADDSQDAFLETDKQPYKSCDTLKIRYSEDFTKAVWSKAAKANGSGTAWSRRPCSRSRAIGR